MDTAPLKSSLTKQQLTVDLPLSISVTFPPCMTVIYHKILAWTVDLSLNTSIPAVTTIKSPATALQLY